MKDMKQFTSTTDNWGQSQSSTDGGERWHHFILYEAIYPDQYPADWFSDEMFSFEFRGAEKEFEFMEI